MLRCVVLWQGVVVCGDVECCYIVGYIGVYCGIMQCVTWCRVIMCYVMWYCVALPVCSLYCGMGWCIVVLCVLYDVV